MKRKFYLPRQLEKRAQWLNNFANTFEKVAPLLNFTLEEVQSVKNDAAMINWVSNVQVIMNSTRKSFTAFKNIMNEGTAKNQQATVPELPQLPPPPALVAPNIFKRITKLVQRIKHTKGYTQAMGEKLGIIGSEQKLDVTRSRPHLSLKMVAGKLEVHWKKGVFHGITIYINRHDEKGFVKTTTYTISPAKINIELPKGETAALWQVMAFYVLRNDTVGQPSAIAEIMVRQPAP